MDDHRGAQAAEVRRRPPEGRPRCEVATDNQEETDRYWNAIVGNGGKESECGWCKDRWGICWQITPRTLTEALAAGDVVSFQNSFASRGWKHAAGFETEEAAKISTRVAAELNSRAIVQRRNNGRPKAE